MTITCYLARVIVDEKINDGKQITSSTGHFDGHGGVLRKPLDAAIGQLLTLFRIALAATRATVNKTTMKNTPLCWPFRWLWWCAGTIPHKSPDGGGSRLSKEPLNAAIGRALAPILPNWTCLPLILGVYFIVKSTKKGLS